MLQQETSKALLSFANNAEFCKAWKAYIEDFIKMEDLNIERFAYGDQNIFTAVARKKLLKEFLIMPDRVRGIVK